MAGNSYKILSLSDTHYYNDVLNAPLWIQMSRKNFLIHKYSSDQDYLTVASWCHMATEIWVNIDSDNSMLPYGTKSLPKSVLTLWRFCEDFAENWLHCNGTAL